MPIQFENDIVYLSDQCSIEEAESLYEVLKGIQQPIFDLSGAEHLHASIVQLMMASPGFVRGEISDPVLAACFRGRIAS